VSNLTTPTLTLLLDLRAAAKSLSISARTLHGLAVRGEVRSVRIGRRRLFDPRDLTALIDARKQ